MGGGDQKNVPGDGKKKGVREEGSWGQSLKDVKQDFSRVKQKAIAFLKALFMDHLDQNHLSDLLRGSTLGPPLTYRVRIYLRGTMQLGILTRPLHYFPPTPCRLCTYRG